MIEDITNKTVKNLFFRNCTIGVLDSVNKLMYVDQVIDDKVNRNYVSVFYQFGMDENFMKDFFIELPHGCQIPSHAEGNFEIWPKGLLQYTGFSVRPGDITNKFVRGSLKLADIDEETGARKLKAYSAYLFSLPVTVNYKLEIHADTWNQGFSLIESLLEALYKQYIFYFQYRGTRIPGQFQISDSINASKKFEFNMDDNNKLVTDVDLEVETYFPIFDQNSLTFKGAGRIMKFISSISVEEGGTETSEVVPED